ncbi:MAG: hypothetical protein RIB60_01810 [Phycisphaerales bacterium]
MSAAHQPMTEDRRRVFLEVLATTGSMQAAAAAASPHCTGRRPGYETFRDLIRSDPSFAEAVAEARQRALGRVEEEIARRAFAPDERPIFGKDGKLLGVQSDHRNANTLLLRLAERLDPEAWTPKKHLSGTVSHQHEHSHAVMFALEARHVLLLEPHDQEALMSLLGRLRERLAMEAPSERPAAIAGPGTGHHESEGTRVLERGGPRDG